MKQVDYSDRAVSQRIERLGQLRTLCVELKKASNKVRKTQK